jgi:hypothetical protein
VKWVANLTIALGLLIFVLGGAARSPASVQVTAVRAAMAHTVDAKTSRFTLSVSASAASALPSEYDVGGVMDYVHHRGRITYGPSAEAILDGDVVYVRWRTERRQDSRWIRYSRDWLKPDPFSFQEHALHDPIGLLSFLSLASDDLKNRGTEDVRGTETTHYEGTLNLRKLSDDTGSASVPFGLWVDTNGVARRLRIDSSTGASAVIEYYDFGIPITITAPRANETISLDEFVREAKATGANSDCHAGEAKGRGHVKVSGSGFPAGQESIAPPGGIVFLCADSISGT